MNYVLLYCIRTILHSQRPNLENEELQMNLNEDSFFLPLDTYDGATTFNDKCQAYTTTL